MRRALLLWIVAIGSLAGPVRAQERPTRVERGPEIDGSLDDAVWERALVVDDFLQRAPREGGAPTEYTRVLLLYTETALYVGVEARDSRPGEIVATVLKRDDFAATADDQFAIAIDSHDDGRNGFWFSTNPLGARLDAQFFDEGAVWQSEWNGVWASESRRGPEGWTVEMEIPFSTLRFEPAVEVVMGINLFRRIIRTHEALFAPLIPLQYACGSCNVSIARKYAFRGITGGRRGLRIEPYLLVGRREAATEAGDRDRSSVTDAGVDVRYGLTDDLRLDLSVNTDFALAEVDERQIDLSRFDLFFPEKRDFFLEDAGIFSFGAPAETDVFFSRRIGIARDESGAARAVPILAGGKLTGRAGPVEIGLLDVRTESTSTTEWRNYGVGRFKVGVGDRSHVGGIATSVTGPGSGDEIVIGVDGTVHFGDLAGVRGFAAGLSRDPEGEEAREDAGTWALSLFREGERLAFEAGVARVGEEFAPVAGFVTRRGIRKWSGRLAVPRYLDGAGVRRWTPSVDAVVYDDLSGGVQTAAVDATVAVDLVREDRVALRLGRRMETVEREFGLFRDVLVPAGEYDWLEGGIEASTKPGRALSGSVGAVAGGYFGGRRVGIEGSLRWKLGRHLVVSPYHSSSWVELGDESFTARLTRLRANLSVDTHLSMGALIQRENQTGQLASHVRLDYWFGEGEALSVVWNEVGEGSGFEGAGAASPGSRVLLLKLTHRWNLGGDR